MSSSGGISGGSVPVYTGQVSLQDSVSGLNERSSALAGQIGDLQDALGIALKALADAKNDRAALGTKPDDEDEAKEWQNKANAIDSRIRDAEGKVSNLEAQIHSKQAEKDNVDNNLIPSAKAKDDVENNRRVESEKKANDTKNGASTSAADNRDQLLPPEEQKKLRDKTTGGNSSGPGGAGIGAGVP